VSELTQVGVEHLLGPQHTVRVNVARAVVMYLLRTEAALTSVEVGRIMRRSYATVLDITERVALDESGIYADLLARARWRLEPAHSRRAGARQPEPWSAPTLLLGLRTARRLANLRQAELARRSGLSAETISRLENQRKGASAKSARALALALGVPIATLRRATITLPGAQAARLRGFGDKLPGADVTETL
jgi:DNA-binding XRE family transcriptional regulator